MRVLTIISGVIVILTGLWCVANQGVAFAALAFILGSVMVINGIIGATAFVKMKNRPEGMGWALSDALMGIVLGCIVLSNQLATDLMIIMFFGMWMLFSGCNRIVGSLTLRKQENISWSWTMGLGVISTLAGIYSFLNSNFAGITLGILIGIFFLIQGTNVLTFGIGMPHAKRHHHFLHSEKNKEK